MKTVESPKSLRSRGIYLLPNLFTLAALFAGFYAVVAAMKGSFQYSAIAIFLAMVFDALDGRIARLTNTQTKFGAELDSLSDMVSFGVAPALLIYTWALSELGKIGWLLAFIFAAGTALRLARFNTQVDKISQRYFQGLPCPPAAGGIASLVWLMDDFDVLGSHVNLLAGLLAFVLGLLMVSNIRYYSFKEFDLKGKVPFLAILLVMLIFVLISINPPQVLFIGLFIYLLSGPVLTVWQLYHRRATREKNKRKTK